MRQERLTILRVLIVDDSEAIRSVMCRVLSSSQGMAVIGSACNGAEAVEKVDETLPDVVVMDVDMPIMDGLEATRRIKRAHPAIVVVLVSGSTNLLNASLFAGADGYLTKPFSADSLISRVKGDLEITDTP